MSNRYVILEDRALLALFGADVRSFLQGIITQDVETLSPSRSVYSALLSAQGKFLCDFFLIQQPDAIWLECSKAHVAKLYRLLHLYKLRSDVHITEKTDAFHIAAAMGNTDQLALPQTAGRTERFHEDAITAYIDPRHPALGARVIAAADEGQTWLIQRGFDHATQSDYEQHRILLGIPGDSDNIVEKTLLLENGFEELHGVQFNKGCYIGQEVTARTKHRASLHKLLHIVESEHPLTAGSTITLGEREVGDIRSVQDRVGLALIRNEAVAKATAETPLMANGHALEARLPEWRNKRD